MTITVWVLMSWLQIICINVLLYYTTVCFAHCFKMFIMYWLLFVVVDFVFRFFFGILIEI